MPSLRASSTAADRTAADVVVIGVARRDGRPVPVGGSEPVNSALDGRLARVLVAAGATGRAEQAVRLATFGEMRAPGLLAVGLGDTAAHYPPALLRRAAGAAVRHLAGTRRVATTLALANGDSDPADLRAVAEGSLLGAYDFLDYRSESLTRWRRPVEELTILSPAARTPATGREIARAVEVAAAVSRVRDLVNTPAGELPPAVFADIAVAEGRAAGLDVEVTDHETLRRRGYGGITGVGQGSTRPPRLVRLRWRPRGGRLRKLALVGKGITFDSGGLSIKGAKSMEWMKADMAGAATVFATALAAARLELPVAVTSWLPLAENMPSGAAIRPGDVLTMYGGKRVEVLNTDAEGRLVLADTLVRAAEDRPDAVVDVATLTGAQITALGTRTSALMGTDEGLRDQLLAAAATAGEDIWPMPFPAELRRGLNSPVADLRNIGDPHLGGGMLVAGVFLAQFVPAGLPWAHLDIAGPSFNEGRPHGFTPRGGTGAMVATLVQLADDMGT